MKKVKVIDKSIKSKCWVCDGKGYTNTICNKKYACDACPITPCKNVCKACEGTGKWVEPSYILVAETPNKQKIAFQTDSPGK